MPSVLLTELIRPHAFCSTSFKLAFFLNVVSVLCVAIRLPAFFHLLYGLYFIPWLVSFVMYVIATLSSCYVNVQLLNRLYLLSVPRLYRLLTLCRLSSKYVEDLCLAY
jgi:Kef-type K+ transport system membrane component KefB